MLVEDVIKQTGVAIVKVILIRVPTMSKNLILSIIYKDISLISPYFKSF